MTPAKMQDTSEKRREDAVAWHVRLTSGDADDANWAGFAAWLEADAANRAAFDQVEDLYDDIESTADSILPALRDTEAQTNVIPLTVRRAKARPMRPILSAGIALLAATTIFFAAVQEFTIRPSKPEMTEYTTKFGEAKTVSLADGSVIDLNTNTKLAVSLGGATRQVRIDQGEALFHVAKDLARPFAVVAGDVNIRDIGTVFNVLRNAGSLTVTVAEGKVAVSPRNATAFQSGNVAQLSSGDQLVHKEGSGKVSVHRSDPAAVLGWRNGYLTYENAPLSEVVSDLNRYFPGVISLQDDAVASRRFSGVLQVDDETAVIDRLAKFLSLDAVRSGNGNITLRIKAGSN